MELLTNYRTAVNYYQHLSEIPAFTERIFENILLTQNIRFFAEGQKFLLMAVLVQCLSNQDLNVWLERLDSISRKIQCQSPFRDIQELKENQLEIFMIIAIHQNTTLNLRNRPFLLDVKRSHSNDTDYIDLRRFSGKNHKLRVLWYVVHKIDSRRWIPIEHRRTREVPYEWLAFCCDREMKDLLMNFIKSINVFTFCTTTLNGQYFLVWVGQRLFRQSLSLIVKSEVFNIIMAAKYAVGNWFDAKPLIVNYLMQQALDPAANWDKFVKDMRIFEDVYEGEHVHYFEIYEVALHSHNKLFLFPVMVRKFHQLFLDTIDDELFTIAQRYFIKGMHEVICSSAIVSNMTEFMHLFDLMTDGHKEYMYQCEEAQSNRNRMRILSNFVKSTSQMNRNDSAVIFELYSLTDSV